MLEKLTPLIILALFVAATLAIMQGLNRAHDLAHPKKMEKTTP